MLINKVFSEKAKISGFMKEIFILAVYIDEGGVNGNLYNNIHFTNYR